MKTRTILTALTVALLLSHNIFSQFEISGKIVNDVGKPIVGATVRITSLNKGAVSTDNGKYLIQDVPKGTHTISVYFFGFNKEERTVEIAKNTSINFTIFPTIFLKEGVEILGVRATKNTPTTFTNISSEEIERINYGQDLPFLLRSLPSTVVSSDAGTGIGYTNFRIRGVDPTRTNITINGIPVNDAESQNVFWVNMPDLASSVSSIQVQRGVGTSTNGSSAFGASINIKTNLLRPKAYATIDNSVGSFNTWKTTISTGTGLINNKFTVDARLSRIISEGYVDRASSNLKSFYLSGAYHGKKSTLKMLIFSGKEKTYQSWNGVPESRINGNNQEMLAYAGRNGLDAEATQLLLESGRTYNAYTYNNATDNYQQDNYQMHYDFRINRNWKGKAALHFTRGKGYYENLKPSEGIAEYGISPIVANGDTITSMDLVRRKWLDNYFGGGIFNINYNNLKGLSVTLGGAANTYFGKHFGTVIWAEYMPNNKKDFEYYNNNATKNSSNLYLKAIYKWNKLSFFADAQYRYIDYSFLGVDDHNGTIIPVRHRVFYNFFNPKAGLIFNFNEQNSIYLSYALSNREPIRDDFVGTTPENQPLPEQLYDLEAGYHLTTEKGFLNATIYHMMYKNQLILTGEINDVGEYIRTNIDDSYRMGIELQGGYQILKQLGISANITLSRNKAKNYTEYIDSYDASWNTIPQTQIKHKLTDLAFSPEIIGGVGINYLPIENLLISLSGKYVGKQYLDNTSNATRSIDPFFISSLNISYSFSFWKFKEIIVSGKINNLFNEFYSAKGYTFSYLVGGERTQENFYFPQAGINFMTRLVIKL